MQTHLEWPKAISFLRADTDGGRKGIRKKHKELPWVCYCSHSQKNWSSYAIIQIITMKLFCNEEVIKMLSNKSKEFASKKKKKEKNFLG